MEKIIDRILTDFRWTPRYFNDFCSENKLDKSSRSAFKSSLESTIKELSSERDQIIIPKYKTEKFKRINPVTNWYSDMSEWDKGNPLKNNSRTFRTYPPGTDIKKAERDEKRKDELKEKIFYLDEMLQRVNLYPGKETTPTKENENNIKVSNKYSEYGELNNLLYEFLDLPEFKALKIPKHETLKSNHLAAIKKLLRTKFPEFPIEKWNSFLTKLKKQDYSRSRD